MQMLLYQIEKSVNFVPIGEVFRKTMILVASLCLGRTEGFNVLAVSDRNANFTEKSSNRST